MPGTISETNENVIFGKLLNDPQLNHLLFTLFEIIKIKVRILFSSFF